jgi:TRAP-type mannitol/chloroaromatic compound transport system substrate-binding protein
MQAKSLALLALLLLTAPRALAAGAATVTLVTPIVYGTHLPGLGEPAGRLARLIKERSGGSLALDLRQPGDGTRPQEILDKVGSGSVDAGFATASFWAAKIPAAALFAGFPFGPDGKTYLAWFETGDGKTLYQEMYDHAGMNVHVMPCAFGGAEAGGWFAKEIKTPDDIKGLRMRIFGLGGRVLSKLGATTVIVPGGNLVKAFDKGDIDAAELYTPAADREQDLKSKVKLIYVPGWHQPETVLELLINKDRWNAFTAEQRALIEGACQTVLDATLAEEAKLQADALGELAAKDGVRIADWPSDVLAAFRSAWADVAKDEGERDYFFKTVLDDIENFRAKPKSTGEGSPADQASPGPPEPQAPRPRLTPDLDLSIAPSVSRDKR